MRKAEPLNKLILEKPVSYMQKNHTIYKNKLKMG